MYSQVSGGLVNFKKCRAIAAVLEGIIKKQMKNSDLNMERIPSLQNWLNDLTTFVKSLKKVDLSELKEHFQGLSASLVTYFEIRVSNENVYSRGSTKQIEVGGLVSFFLNIFRS